ncbi:MAG: hypothetical protein R3F61_24255 [Myxococcota bacterium]
MLIPLVASLSAHAVEQEVAEEVIVYADPLGPWDGTRWWVAAESISGADVLELVAKDGSFRAPAWQVSAVIACEIVERRKRGGLVECVPEDVALRVVTPSSWQREEDRAIVAGGLADLVREMEQSSVRLRVRDHGDVVIVRDQPDGEFSSRVLERAFDAFHLDLPDEGWVDGSQWVATEEPLLDMLTPDRSFGLEQVVHYGNRFRDQLLIQTIGGAKKSLVTGEIQQDAHHDPRANAKTPVEIRMTAEWRPLEPGEWRPPIELTRTATLRLDATAILDAELGFVTERVWVVQGNDAFRLTRSGRLRLLGDDEQIDLGITGQVAPPHTIRPGLPRWTPVDPEIPQ